MKIGYNIWMIYRYIELYLSRKSLSVHHSEHVTVNLKSFTNYFYYQIICNCGLRL